MNNYFVLFVNLNTEIMDSFFVSESDFDLMLALTIDRCFAFRKCFPEEYDLWNRRYLHFVQLREEFERFRNSDNYKD